jgi:hypothetical protein
MCHFIFIYYIKTKSLFMVSNVMNLMNLFRLLSNHFENSKLKIRLLFYFYLKIIINHFFRFLNLIFKSLFFYQYFVYVYCFKFIFRKAIHSLINISLALIKNGYLIYP